MTNIIYTKTIPHPEYDHLQVVFEAHSELDEPEFHFEFPDHVEFATSGKEACWFSACVKVELKGTPLVGVDYLGCCSYESWDDFMSDAYFTDMIEEATQDLFNDMNDTTDKINEFVENYNKAS